MEVFSEDSQQSYDVDYFLKKLHCICLTGFQMHLRLEKVL